MASRGVNKVILVGHLGADPEVRYTQSGSSVANLRIATSERWKDKQSGEPQERTEWHRVVLFGKLGEIAEQYLKKGSQVYIEGRLQTRKWQGQDGQDRYSTEVVGSDMQMLGGRGASGGRDGSSSSGSGDQASGNYEAPGRAPEPASSAPLEDDDIPF